MPNVTIDTAVEVSHAALVGCMDERLESYVRLHPAVGSFFKRFHDEFGAQIWPTVTMISEDAPKSVSTVEALGAFRDAICISAIVSAHARTLSWRLWCKSFEVEPSRRREVALDHAARTAVQILGAVLPLAPSLPSLN